MYRKQYICIATFFLSFCLIDFSIGLFFKNKFHEIDSGAIGQISRALNSVSDLFIVGSSRAKYHYNPYIISSITNIDSYNAGLDGYGIYYNYALIMERIKINKPKVVILDISPNIFVDTSTYEKLNLFIPYSSSYESFNEIIQIKPSYSYQLRWINSIVYNSSLYDISRNYFFPKDFDPKGYDPIRSINKDKIDKYFKYNNEEIDENKIYYFKKVLEICNKNNIELICVISPTLNKYDDENLVVDLLKEQNPYEDIHFWDYSDHYEFYGKDYLFKDQLHLNSIGADKFSIIISNRIKEL